jgi:hypothetical protein
VSSVELDRRRGGVEAEWREEARSLRRFHPQHDLCGRKKQFRQQVAIVVRLFVVLLVGVKRELFFW